MLSRSSAVGPYGGVERGLEGDLEREDEGILLLVVVWKYAFGDAAGQRRGDCVDEAVGGRLAAFMREAVAGAAADDERARRLK